MINSFSICRWVRKNVEVLHRRFTQSAVENGRPFLVKEFAFAIRDETGYPWPSNIEGVRMVSPGRRA